METSQLTLTENSKLYLLTARKWSKFLAILGFIWTALAVIGSIIFMGMGSMFTQLFKQTNSHLPFEFNFGYFGLIYLIIASLVFIPNLFLYKFSNNLRDAILTENPETLENAFNFLKKHYKFIGIMTLIILGFYLIMLFAFPLLGFMFQDSLNNAVSI